MAVLEGRGAQLRGRFREMSPFKFQLGERGKSVSWMQTMEGPEQTGEIARVARWPNATGEGKKKRDIREEGSRKWGAREDFLRTQGARGQTPRGGEWGFSFLCWAFSPGKNL